MKILVTGAAGFIGSTICQMLCKKKNVKVYGIDNLNSYSGKKIKKLRLKILSKSKNFIFNKVDISNKKKLTEYFLDKKFDIVLHFAAMVGVRYSLKNPSEYLKSNILGFFNLLENLKVKPPKKVIYASSSSVYGEKSKFPVLEKDKLNPINIYALSKLNNEQMAEMYSKKLKIQFAGLRLFTVFGEMGRPDMFFFKILKCFYKNKTFRLNNNGNHYRDFTYIGDVKHYIKKLIFKNLKKKHEIFNICSDKPISLIKVINFIKTKLGNINIINVPINKADVYKTHGSNKKISKYVNLVKKTNYKIAILKTIKWYKKYRIFDLD